MAQSQSSTAAKSMWALIRFPNYQGDVQVVNTNDLFVSTDNNKPVAFRPKDVHDFKVTQAYVCKTRIDSLDGEVHPYSVQIGKLSESKEELDKLCNVLKDKSAPDGMRFRWRTIPNFPSDPDSSGTEDLVGLNVIRPSQSEKKALQKRKRLSENAALDRFMTNSKLVQQTTNESSSLEQKYKKTVHELSKQIQEKEELAREKEVLAREKEKLAREKAELARKLEEKSSKSTTPSVQDLIKAVQSEVIKMCREQQIENQRLFEEHKSQLSKELQELKKFREEIQIQSMGSQSSQTSITSGIKEGYEEIYKGFHIKKGFKQRLESAETQQDFEDLLIRACYEHDEVIAARGPQKRSSDFEAGAEAFLEDWAVLHGLSRQEAKQRAKGLMGRLARKHRNSEPRGINKVLSEARRRGEDVEEAARLYRASNPRRKSLGGRPPKRSLDMGGSGRSSGSSWSTVSTLERPSTSAGNSDAASHSTSAGTSHTSALDDLDAGWLGDAIVGIGPGPDAPSAQLVDKFWEALPPSSDV